LKGFLRVAEESEHDTAVRRVVSPPAGVAR
jgi:hypothetical protein